MFKDFRSHYVLHPPLHMPNIRELLAHRRRSPIRILQRMWNQLIPKQLINLLERLPLRLRIQQHVTNTSHNIKSKEEIEELEPDIGQCNGRSLRKEEIETPVCEGRDRVAASPDLHGEDFRRVHPGDDAGEGEKEGEDEVHGYHCAQGVAV
jgi:hypothetical protein